MKEKKISELKAYDKNPRKMGKEEFKLLSDSLDEFGDLSGVVFNTKTGNLVGGHQRTNHFRTTNAKVLLTEEFEKPTKAGTTGQGYVVLDGEKYSYREVEWDTDKEQRANILANKVSGSWDFDMLANAFDVDLLLESGFNAKEIGFATTSDQDGVDQDTLTETMESYLTGNIKQVVLYFSSDEFEEVVLRLDKVMDETGVSSHTEAFLKLLKFYEDNRSK